MNTSILMTFSAVWLGALGLIFTFFSEKIVSYAADGTAPSAVIILQLLGAVYLGFAMLNWMAKGNLIGGIYSRPVALGNMAHYMIAGLALLKAASATPHAPALWITGGVFAVFAALFGKVTFTHPLKEATTNSVKHS